MKLTKSNIENIRNHAQRHKIKVTSQQIRKAVAECYPDAADETEFEIQMIPSVVEILLAQQPSQPLDNTPKLGSIQLSNKEKQDLVAGAAREAGLNLIASEIKTIAISIRSGFDDREQLLSEVMNAIVTYAETRIDSHSASLTSAANRIRAKVEAGNSDARTAFASIDSILEATNNDFKSEFEGITSLFETSASRN